MGFHYSRFISKVNINVREYSKYLHLLGFVHWPLSPWLGVFLILQDDFSFDIWKNQVLSYEPKDQILGSPSFSKDCHTEAFNTQACCTFRQSSHSDHPASMCSWVIPMLNFVKYFHICTYNKIQTVLSLSTSPTCYLISYDSSLHLGHSIHTVLPSILITCQGCLYLRGFAHTTSFAWEYFFLIFMSFFCSRLSPKYNEVSVINLSHTIPFLYFKLSFIFFIFIF